MENCLWKLVLLENVGWNLFMVNGMEIYGRNALAEKVCGQFLVEKFCWESESFQKYSIHWVKHCVYLCLMYVFVLVFHFQKMYGLFFVWS